MTCFQTKVIHNQQPKDNRCLGGFVLKIKKTQLRSDVMVHVLKNLTINKNVHTNVHTIFYAAPLSKIPPESVNFCTDFESRPEFHVHGGH